MKKFKYSKSFYFSIILIITLFLIATTKDTLYLILLFSGSALLAFNPFYLLPVYIISSLYGEYFDLGNGISISRIIGIIFIFGSILYYRNNFKIDKKQLIFLTLILFLNLFSSLFSFTGSFRGFVMMLPNLAIVFICSGIRFEDSRKIAYLLSISAIISIVFIAVTLREQLLIIQVERLKTGESANENRVAMMLVQLLAILFAALTISKEKKYKVVLFLAILIAFFMLILTGSRSATIGITLATMLIYLHMFLKEGKKYILPIIVFSIICFLTYQAIIQSDNPIFQRFSEQSIIDGKGTSRLDNWKALIPYTLNNNPIFGVGLGGDTVYALAHKIGARSPAHNFILDLFIQTGFVGLILYMYYFLLIAKKIKQHLNNSIMYFPYWMLLAAFINGIGETVFSEKLFWNGIALALLFANNLPQNNLDNKIHKKLIHLNQ